MFRRSEDEKVVSTEGASQSEVLSCPRSSTGPERFATNEKVGSSNLSEGTILVLFFGVVA